MSLNDPWEPPFEHLIGEGTQSAPLTTLIERRITNIWPDPTTPNPIYWSHNDRVARPEYGIPGGFDPNGFTMFDDVLKDVINYTGPGYIGTHVRGYSGFTWPATFQETSVADAPSKGLPAMLNVKTPTVHDWKDVVAGLWDDHIQTFFESWPSGTPGTFTLNHEPENDVGNDLPSQNPYRPYNNRNPVYSAWAQEWGPIWCRSIARVIKVAAPIIRARGLDVTIGGCLMEYSWNSYTLGRWHAWRWWDYVDPADFDVAEFQIDIYGNSVNGEDGVYYEDLIPRFQTAYKAAQAAGIHQWSIYEMAVTKVEKNGGGNVLPDPNDSIRAAWWTDFADRIAEIPGGRFINYFAVPDAPVEAWIRDDSLVAFANICLNNGRI